MIILPADAADAYALAPRLRSADRREIEIASGMDPESVLHRALEESEEAYAVIHQDRHAALFGVRSDPMRPHMGIVWLLAAPEVSRCAKALLKAMPSYLSEWLERYAGLHNYVLLENDLHVRWLALLGFRFGTVVEVGGHPFVYFIKNV